MIAIQGGAWEKIKPYLERECTVIDEVGALFPDTIYMENTISIDITEERPAIITPVEIRNKNIIIKTWALWDTGATKTGISKRIASRLQLEPTGKKEEILTATDMISVDCACLEVKISNTTYRPIEVNIVPDQPSNMVIGLDVICLGQFEIKRTEKGACMTFKVEW